MQPDNEPPIPLKMMLRRERSRADDLSNAGLCRRRTDAPLRFEWPPVERGCSRPEEESFLLPAQPLVNRRFRLRLDKEV